MSSQDLLSNAQYNYITSQTEIVNLSEQKKRIYQKIDQCFKTFNVILISETLPQNFVDEVFNDSKIHEFLSMLVRYDKENMLADEANKQRIARDMIQLGFTYFRDRYRETTHLKKPIDTINSLLRELDSLSEQQIGEKENMELYRARVRSMQPPQIVLEKDFWNAECVYCFAYSLGLCKNEKEAIKNIKHRKGCRYPKIKKRFGGRDDEMLTLQYIRTIPPKETNKSKKRN